MENISLLNRFPYQASSDVLTTSFAISSRQTLDLGITTAEGDQVTLSSRASSSVGYAICEGPESTVQAHFETRDESLSLAIQGDLSKSETRDVRKAIHAYGKVLKDVLSGRTQPAEAHIRELERLRQISSVSGTYTSEQSFTAKTQAIAVSA